MPDYVHKATFWMQMTRGSIYVRMELPARHLPARVLPFLHKDLFLREDDTPVFPRQQGAAIWQYPGSATNALLIAAMQTRGIRCLVETDDDYINGAPKNPVYKSEWYDVIDKQKMLKEGDYFSYEAHKRIVEFSDGVIVSTAKLAETYAQHHDNVYVCPNCVDPDDWPEPKQRDGIFRVGFAGSLSHYLDLNLTKRAFEWLAKQKDVELVFLGLYPRWTPGGQVKLIDWTDEPSQYRQSLVDARLDVGLAPIIDYGTWASGKSDVKALEYAMSGALPLVQEHPSFELWQQRGLVAKDSDGFLEQVQWCYEHQDEVRRMAREAREHVLNDRSIQNNVHLWQEAIDGKDDDGQGNYRESNPGVPERQCERAWT